MSEVIVVTSGKGGVGKTTTAANIGTGLAALDKKVRERSCRTDCSYIKSTRKRDLFYLRWN